MRSEGYSTCLCVCLSVYLFNLVSHSITRQGFLLAVQHPTKIIEGYGPVNSRFYFGGTLLVLAYLSSGATYVTASPITKR